MSERPRPALDFDFGGIVGIFSRCGEIDRQIHLTLSKAAPDVRRASRSITCIVGNGTPEVRFYSAIILIVKTFVGQLARNVVSLKYWRRGIAESRN
jgi:hypothetical protein